MRTIAHSGRTGRLQHYGRLKSHIIIIIAYILIHIISSSHEYPESSSNQMEIIGSKSGRSPQNWNDRRFWKTRKWQDHRWLKWNLTITIPEMLMYVTNPLLIPGFTGPGLGWTSWPASPHFSWRRPTPGLPAGSLLFQTSLAQRTCIGVTSAAASSSRLWILRMTFLHWALFWGITAGIPEPRSQYTRYLSRGWSWPAHEFESAITPRMIYHFSAQSSQTPTILSRRMARSQTLVLYLSWCWFASILELICSIFEGFRNFILKYHVSDHRLFLRMPRFDSWRLVSMTARFVAPMIVTANQTWKRYNSPNNWSFLSAEPRDSYNAYLKNS
jgi:hypothetical protein